MSDLALRDLEREALAADDRATWQRYYVAKRRAGWDQPAGSATWRLDFEGEAIRLMFRQPWESEKPDRLEVVQAHADRARALVASVEQEWARCGTGLAIEVRSERGSFGLVAPWRDALFLPSLSIPSVQLDEPEHLGLELGAVGPLVVTGPAFLRDPIVLFMRPPRPGAPVLVDAYGPHRRGVPVVIEPNTEIRVNPEALARPAWAQGVRVSG